ncbi:MAG: hypothetical protein IPO25_23035 [Saprospiraceae bacterium]|nr:hypothetical protein [Saprospiraceae bacterium]
MYGVSSILARMVNFILDLSSRGVQNRGDYGVVGQLYALDPALGVGPVTFRMEASYFRYTSNDDKSSSLCQRQSL